MISAINLARSNPTKEVRNNKEHLISNDDHMRSLSEPNENTRVRTAVKLKGDQHSRDKKITEYTKIKSSYI